MRTLVYSMMVSLDGYTARPDGALDWVRIDEELHRFANEQARQAEVFLYGRRMYETMTYWGTAERDPAIPEHMREFARIWAPKPKIVFSSTLTSVDWNSTLVRDDVVEVVTRMKAEGDGELAVSGPTVAAPLIERGLVDEFQLMVQPVAIGSGTRYMPSLDRSIDLELLETRTFRSGVVYVRYRRVTAN